MNQHQFLFSTIASLENPRQAQRFLEGILTPTELNQVVTRLEIVRRLKNGEAQHRIAADLRVGVATVTRGSREIKKGNFDNV